VISQPEPSQPAAAASTKQCDFGRPRDKSASYSAPRFWLTLEAGPPEGRLHVLFTPTRSPTSISACQPALPPCPSLLYVPVAEAGGQGSPGASQASLETTLLHTTVWDMAGVSENWRAGTPLPETPGLVGHGQRFQQGAQCGPAGP